MSRSNCCTTPISHKSSDAHTPTLPFVAVKQSGGKPTALAYPTVTSKSSPVNAWRLTSPATTSSGLILTVTYNVRGCLSRCYRTATSSTLRPFLMRSNRAGSSASFTLLNTSAARRRSLSWTMQRHSSSTRVGTRAKCSRRCNYYDIEPWACQPRRPMQKNRVEAGVGLAQRRIIAAMGLERTPMVRDLDYLNEQVKAKLEELNNAPFTAELP